MPIRHPVLALLPLWFGMWPMLNKLEGKVRRCWDRLNEQRGEDVTVKDSTDAVEYSTWSTINGKLLNNAETEVQSPNETTYSSSPPSLSGVQAQLCPVESCSRAGFGTCKLQRRQEEMRCGDDARIGSRGGGRLVTAVARNQQPYRATCYSLP
ncbi:hypothetical protein IW262DRAFT_1291159 [Armillaria fumosa]|nr:hypothetical protein IW262DRAFT_1291159 [Armillaria fumosa]